MKSLKQNTKAKNDLSDIAVTLFLGIQKHHCADTDTDRCDAGYVQRDQDTCDGRTDVRSEDNAGRLRKVHDLSIDKAHYHDCRSRGRLNNDSNKCTEQKAHDPVARQLFEQLLHFRTCCELKAFSHVLHTKQECA